MLPSGTWLILQASQLVCLPTQNCPFIDQFAGLVVLTDIITFILLFESGYETIKFFLIATLLCQLIIVMPFAISGKMSG